MLINDVRALAYTTRISWVRPIAGADNIELVGIGGWICIAKIGEFREGDICVYFEIDSKLPSDKEWCAFMESKKFKVKTMKLSKFGVVSQGLALPVNVFDIEIPNEENIDLTEKLGVTYADAEDNQRKALQSHCIFPCQQGQAICPTQALFLRYSTSAETSE